MKKTNALMAKGELLPLKEATPTTLLERAVHSGASIEVLERLMALQERWEATQARKAFEMAMSAIRSDLPAIIKDQTVDYTSARGRTNYRYESLHAVTEALSPVMARYGLSFRWRTNTDVIDTVSVTCVLSHAGGHSEEVTLVAKHDHSGSKNDIQALGSAVTYLQRYTLKAALGVAAAADDDGNGAGTHDEERLPEQSQAKPAQPKPVTGAQRPQNEGGSPEELPQTAPRGHKYERTAAHNHLEQVIEEYCKANDISPDKEGLDVLERMSAYIDRDTHKNIPGVRDVLLLSEKAALITRRQIKDTIDKNRNWRMELGQAIIQYCQDKKITKEEVLKACSDKTTLRDLDQPAAKKAFEKFERLLNDDPYEEETYHEDDKKLMPQKEEKKTAKGKSAAKSTNGKEPEKEKFDPKETALALIRNATKQNWNTVKETVLGMVKEIKGSQNLLDVTTAINNRQGEISSGISPS